MKLTAPLACLTATGTLLLCGTVTAQHAADRVNGADAVRALGTRLPAVARQHGMTPADLTALFQRDRTLWLFENDRLAYVDTAVPQVEQDAPVEPETLAGVPLENAFLLQTDPGADRTIYLDFDGHHSVNNSWNHNIVFPPYNLSGSSGTFDDVELAEIISIWKHVAEDYAPYNVNVTTMDPGLAALTKSNGADQTYGTRCVMTQPTSGFGNGIGGVAFLNSFDDSIDNPVFVFNKGPNNGSMSASHEVGHALGLSHDGLFGLEYHPGAGSGSTSWGPIMGAPFGMNLVQWSKGEYNGATNTQNDLAIMLNYIPARSDDHADTIAPATLFGPGCSTVQGIIGTSTDVDDFTFTTTAGDVTLIAQPADPGPNLDLRLTIYDDQGTQVLSYNPAASIGAEVTFPFAAGQYYASIDGVGLPGVYTDYGSIGQFTIQLELPVCPCAADLNHDGNIGIDDFLQLLGAWGFCFGCPEDIDGDFEVGINDFLQLLATWGPCPL